VRNNSIGNIPLLLRLSPTIEQMCICKKLICGRIMSRKGGSSTAMECIPRASLCSSWLPRATGGSCRGGREAPRPPASAGLLRHVPSPIPSSDSGADPAEKWSAGVKEVVGLEGDGRRGWKGEGSGLPRTSPSLPEQNSALSKAGGGGR
jgi:hypothetical protein